MNRKIIITIGRQFGSGGLEVARLLGKKLGIPVYDRELILKAAQDSGFSPELFEESDETRKMFSIKTLLTQGFTTVNNYIGEEELFKMQSDTIRNIAEQGSAVIVGRCSDYILRDLDCKLDVFLTSPIEARIDRIVERMRISAEEAEELIRKNDRQRELYYNYYTFGNWGVASTYDLCIDSSITGSSGTADMIIDFARKARLLSE